jgi:hypothetical protein
LPASFWLSDGPSRQRPQGATEIFQIQPSVAPILTAQRSLPFSGRLRISAVASRPENPFPFIFYEFGARCVIEAQLQYLSGRDVLMMAVVDARTGIVLMQQSDPISAAPPAIGESISRTVQALEPLFELQTSGGR